MSSIKLFFCVFFVINSVFCSSDGEYVVTTARVESCRGCSLNRLPQVKQFIYEDLPHYPNVEFKPIHGAPPEIVLLSEMNEEMQRLPLSHLTRLECNELLETYGFKRSDASNEEIIESKNPSKSEF